MRTRVGYAGGTKADPNYTSLGDHSETIEIDYDPSVISYEELLEVFWDSHNPSSRPFSQQYASLILYHDEEQQQLAALSREREEARRGGQVFTEIRPYSTFFLAEDYHQKYWLQQVPTLMGELRSLYPDPMDLVNSTVAARLNGFIGGNSTLEDLEGALEDLNLPGEVLARLLEAASNSRP